MPALSLRSIAPLFALSLLSAGCSAARMQLDPALTAKAPEQAVSGTAFAAFRKPVTFGAYTATLTKGGFQTNKSTSVGPYQRKESKQAFDFSLVGGTPASWAGSCAYGTALGVGHQRPVVGVAADVRKGMSKRTCPPEHG
ncbi:hypothetical protein OV203_04125 [Nannocystis sp. ILAH1]|uniref:hypothetical protein n=1 Tax=Nannocystis sp. ILAH1 TaxID=2996789 RepID=UPI00227156E9|nr:hypothetical protein [Nannocystis sp. ILAH1]MCY0986301.1 hypothetical protein [Nannocystis sp. ILAH1]